MFALAIDHFQFALIHGPDIPGSYAILLFTASDLASITSRIHNWVLFLLWLHPFILSGVISPLVISRPKLEEDGKVRKSKIINKFQRARAKALGGLTTWLSGKGSSCQCRRHRFDPWVGKISWRRKWPPTPVFLPGESHGHRSLVGCRPWKWKRVDMTE